MKYIVSYILILVLIFSCKKYNEFSAFDNQGLHIKYFGFTLIDTYWDDPTDSEIKTNYADEISEFSNLGDILILNPNDNIIDRIQVFANYELKAILHLNELFFQLVDTNSPSGANYNLRPDYQERWNEFKMTNKSILNAKYIAAFYIGEEPTWNGISFNELNSVSELLDNDFPNLPKMVIEAYPSLGDLKVPETVDWIGFDRYFVKNPNEDKVFKKDWELLKSLLSNPSQKIMVIMDSHYINWAHGDFGNIELKEMGEVAKNYYQLANSDEKVIGIIGYFWPNGFDITTSIGARGMPQNVRLQYQQIGKKITRK